MWILATFPRAGGSLKRGVIEEEPVDSDQALMLRFQSGEEEAFVQLYHAYRDRMVAYTTRMLGSLAMGEDATQDVFIKLYRAKSRYRPTARFSTYLYRIATRHCLNLRARHSFKKTRAGLEGDREVTPASGPDDATRVRELRQALRQALNKLPAKQRAGILLVHFEGLSYQEASMSLGVSVTALKSMVHRARNQLSERLDRELSQPMEFKHAM